MYILKLLWEGSVSSVEKYFHNIYDYDIHMYWYILSFPACNYYNWIEYKA
jgi:hypothetical protein